MIFQKICIKYCHYLGLVFWCGGFFFPKKGEKYFGDARLNALTLRLEGLSAALASNLQNYFTHLPVQVSPTILPKFPLEPTKFTQNYTILLKYVQPTVYK